jgi:hypothetical protein
MEKEKLSAREAALIASARREAEARKGSAPAAATPHAAAPAAPQQAAQDKPSPAERLAQLMAEEHAETERRKKKMRRHGIIIPAAIIGIFALWVLSAGLRRR